MDKQKISLLKNGYVKYKLKNIEPLIIVNNIINEYFGIDDSYTDTETFRNKLLKCQDEINQNKIHKVIVSNEMSIFNLLFDNKPISIQSVVYLMGVRSDSTEMLEYLDYHRENFYCDDDYINYQLNISIPIRNYNIKTSMKIIEKSHLISDESITTQKYDSDKSGVEKFSAGHKLGLTYNPKIIVDGIDPNEARRIDLNKDEIFIFSSRLIHGGGINPTSKIRFSLDFAAISTEALGNKRKPHYAAYTDEATHFAELSNI